MKLCVLPVCLYFIIIKVIILGLALSFPSWQLKPILYCTSTIQIGLFVPKVVEIYIFCIILYFLIEIRVFTLNSPVISVFGMD